MASGENPEMLFPEKEAWEMWRMSKQDVPRLIPLAEEKLRWYRNLYHSEHIADSLLEIGRQVKMAKNIMIAGGLVAFPTLALDYLIDGEVSDTGAIITGTGAAFVIMGYMKQRSIRENMQFPPSERVQVIDRYLDQLAQNTRPNLAEGESA